MKGLFRTGCIAAGAAFALTAAIPAIAAANPCPSYPLSQPFLTWGDPNTYTLIPGESAGTVDGQGWQFSGGAHLVTTAVQDGSSGQVLDMPPGSKVVTPPMCVNASNYPRARTMISDVSGEQGVAVYVSYQQDRLLATGMIKNPRPGWSASRPIMLHAGQLRGLHMVRFTFVARRGEYQLYNFYVDPRRGR